MGFTAPCLVHTNEMLHDVTITVQLNAIVTAWHHDVTNYAMSCTVIFIMSPCLDILNTTLICSGKLVSLLQGQDQFTSPFPLDAASFQFSLFIINRPGLFTRTCDLDLCSVFLSPYTCISVYLSDIQILWHKFFSL